MLLAQDKASKRLDQGFDTYLARLTPKYSEPDEAELSRHAIERCLEREFGMSYLAPYGSRGHGTSVEGRSALDGFAVIPKDRLYEQSGKSLETILAALEAGFPEAHLTEGRPVIVVPFGDRRCERHHIVPAYSVGTREAHDLFGIPGPSDRWIEACPGGHSEWINALDQKLNRRLKPFVRLVKAWNYGEGEPIWSFYVELAAADCLATTEPCDYRAALEEFFTYLLKRRLAPFRSSGGSNEPVFATSLAEKFDAMRPVRSALETAKKARFCERHGNIADAYFWWRKLFHYEFPAY